MKTKPMDITISSEETIQIELNVLNEEYHQKLHKIPLGSSLTEYEENCKVLKPLVDKINKLSQQLRLIKTPTFKPLPDYGNVMSLTEFIKCVKSGGFIDYDGFGNYVKDGMITNIEIYPSDVAAGTVRKDFNTIIWFNR
jgi:hypothetical protein